MKTVQINHNTFHYTEEGTGTPVVFIHGSIDDYRTWNHQIPKFSKHFQTIAYSRRYHHPASRDEPVSGYNVPKHAEDLAAFIKKLNLKSVHLVGSSYGAYTGLIMAMRHPDRIRSMVLCEPPVVPLLVSNPNNPIQILSLLIRDLPTGKSFLKFGKNHVFPATKKLREGNFEEGARIFANGVLGPEGFKRLPEKTQKVIIDNAPALKAELLGPGFPRSKTDYSGLKVPVLLVRGEKSPLFFQTISKKLGKLLPESEHIVIPKASHNMHAENPEAFNQKAMDFIKKYDT